jgi:predicted  nucleic acid-binding Zn-ribbon protein
MRSEVQSEGETNSGVFLKQIESLRNENNRLNEYLKQTEIQVKQLENQVSFSQSTIIYKKTYNLNSLF